MNIKTIKYERRLTTTSADKSIRAKSVDGKKIIEGYGAVFNQESRVIYERGKIFKEVISRSAFDNVLKSNPNVIATINHDPNQGVARTKNGSLELSVDDYGLKYRFEVPNTTAGNDLYEMVRSGYYTESSFVYTVDEKGEEWSRNGDSIHTVNEVTGLYDVAIVTDGAFANTDVAVSERICSRAASLEEEQPVSGATETDKEEQKKVEEEPEEEQPSTDKKEIEEPEEMETEEVEEHEELETYCAGIELTIIKLKVV